MNPIRFAIFFGSLALLFGLAITTVVRALWPGRFATPAARRRLRAGAALAIAIVIGLEFLARRHAPVGGGAFRVPVMLGRSLMLTSWIAALGIGLRNAVTAVLTRVRRAPTPAAVAPAAAAPAAALPAADPLALTRRDALSRGSALAITGTSVAVVGFGALKVARDIEVRELEVYIPDLPPALEGLSLVQLTDIHVGVFTGARDFAAVAERTRALRGDLVVMTGDLLDANPAHVPDAMRILASVRGRRGTFAILGNHDYYTHYRAVLAGLRGSGIRPLVNEGVLIPGGASGAPGLALLGLDDVWAGRIAPGRGPDLDAAIATVPRDAPRVVLSHNPTSFELTAGRAALQLSGHTHGGQINPAGLMRLALTYVSGRYERQGSTLFVSNGLGLTGPPVRIAAPPQVVRIGLTGRRRSA